VLQISIMCYGALSKRYKDMRSLNLGDYMRFLLIAFLALSCSQAMSESRYKRIDFDKIRQGESPSTPSLMGDSGSKYLPKPPEILSQEQILSTPELRSKFNRILSNGGVVTDTSAERVACKSPAAFAQYMSFIMYGNTTRPADCFELKPNTRVKIVKTALFQTWDEAMGSKCLFGQKNYSPVDDGDVCCSLGLDVCAFQYDGLRSYVNSDAFYTTLHIISPR